MDWPLPPDDAPSALLLGYSGGLDSTVLLHQLSAWCMANARPLRAVHVHHGLHPEADEWATHCARTTARLGVPLVVHRVDVRRRGRGLEDSAREARYGAFARERRDHETLVLAHHRDDQAETLLLALLRGSGERGLAAMRAFTRDARGPIWRPLLGTPRAELAAYATQHGLEWIEDPSNRDTALARNALRLTVLPLIREHWPQAEAGLARSAALLADADALLSSQAQADVAPLLGLSGNNIDLSGLRALPPPRAQRAIRQWAEACGVRLSSDALRRVFVDWLALPPSRETRHAQGTHWLRQWQGRLWLTPRDVADNAHASNGPAPPWDGRNALALPDGGELHLLGAEALATPLTLTPRAQAPARLRHHASRPARALQSLFAELGVPPWQRAQVPLLVDAEGQLQAVGDLAYGETLDAWLRARGARLFWQPAGPRG